MTFDVHEHGTSKRHSAIVYCAIVGVAIFLVMTLAIVFYRFVVRPTTAATSLTPIENTIPTTEPEEAADAALIVLDGATQMRRDPGAYGSFHVAYALIEKYPASNGIEQISARLKALGWTPLQDDWLNPGLPSSHVRGWTDFVDSTKAPMHHVHQWGAQWQDNSGNIVDYTLRYSYPESGTPDLQSLWINGSWYPVAGVKTMQTATQ